MKSAKSSRTRLWPRWRRPSPSAGRCAPPTIAGAASSQSPATSCRRFVGSFRIVRDPDLRVESSKGCGRKLGIRLEHIVNLRSYRRERGATRRAAPLVLTIKPLCSSQSNLRTASSPAWTGQHRVQRFSSLPPRMFHMRSLNRPGFAGGSNS